MDEFMRDECNYRLSLAFKRYEGSETDAEKLTQLKDIALFADELLRYYEAGGGDDGRDS